MLLFKQTVETWSGFTMLGLTSYMPGSCTQQAAEPLVHSAAHPSSSHCFINTNIFSLLRPQINEVHFNILTRANPCKSLLCTTNIHGKPLLSSTTTDNFGGVSALQGCDKEITLSYGFWSAHGWSWCTRVTWWQTVVPRSHVPHLYLLWS